MSRKPGELESFVSAMETNTQPNKDREKEVPAMERTHQHVKEDTTATSLKLEGLNRLWSRVVEKTKGFFGAAKREDPIKTARFEELEQKLKEQGDRFSSVRDRLTSLEQFHETSERFGQAKRELFQKLEQTFDNKERQEQLETAEHLIEDRLKQLEVRLKDVVVDLKKEQYGTEGWGHKSQERDWIRDEMRGLFVDLFAVQQERNALLEGYWAKKNLEDWIPEEDRNIPEEYNAFGSGTFTIEQLLQEKEVRQGIRLKNERKKRGIEEEELTGFEIHARGVDAQERRRKKAERIRKEQGQNEDSVPA